jgi:hypothetical protein
MLNQIAGRGLAELFRDPTLKREPSYSRGWDAGDLRVMACYDRQKIKALSSDLAPSNVGVIEDYVPGANLDRYVRDCWSAWALRYCPKCICLGAHVTYFQLPLVRNCPIHRIPLRTNCPSCRKAIEYKIPERLAGEAFQCRCGHKLWDWSRKPVSTLSPELLNGHRIAGESVARICRAGEPLHFCWEKPTDDPSSKHCVALGFSNLATFIPTAVPNIGTLTANYDDSIAEFFTVTRFTDPFRSASRPHFARKAQLIATYKSICRNFYRRVFRGHREAIRAVAQISSRSINSLDGELVWPLPFAPVAMAFVLWRMCWEGLISPEDVFCEKTNTIQLGFSTHKSHWKERVLAKFRERYRPSMSRCSPPVREEVELRWFAQVCINTLHESLVHIWHAFEHSKRNNRLTRRLMTNCIQGFLVPLMLPVTDKDGSTTLNWYRPYGAAIGEREGWKSSIRDAPLKTEVSRFREILDRQSRFLVEAVSRRLR